MNVTTYKIHLPGYPAELARLYQPPEKLFVLGANLAAVMAQPRVAVVGSRSITPYGKQMTRDIVRALVSHGVAIVSGLAYGIDAEAHQSALDAGGMTVAVLPSPVQAVAPAGNLRLARSITSRGGALVSTYAIGSNNHKGNFVQRNEYVAALSQAVIVVEANSKSGAKHTANFARGDNINIPVFAVPGNLTSPMSIGCNQMISSDTARIYIDVNHVLESIGIYTSIVGATIRGDNPGQQTLLDLLARDIHDGHILLKESTQDISVFNQNLTMLEIAGKIRPLGGNQWGLA